MSTLAVITPSFRDDAELFADLHRSVLRYTPADTVHHVFVPPGDLQVFARFTGPRCRVRSKSELLPRHFRRIGHGDNYLNLRRPFPPVRGWVTQQAIKLAATAELDAATVLTVDSDVVLVRPVTAAFLAGPAHPPLYRMDNGVHEGMPMHIVWHRVARQLLGLPEQHTLPLPDYVSAFNFWRPEVVRAVQARITAITGRPWLEVFTGQLRVSEFVLYGVFVDEVLGASGVSTPTTTSMCHNAWQDTPLSRPEAMAFAESIPEQAVAVLISAKSRTPLDVRREAIGRCAEIAASA